MFIIQRLLLTVILVLFCAFPAQGQPRLPLSNLFYADGEGLGIDVEGTVNGTPGLVGTIPYGNLPAIVRSATVDGLLTVQLADGTVETIQIITGGGGGGGLTTAQAQSIVGGMVTGNVETGGITLTYNSGTQKLDAAITSIGTDQIADAAVTEEKLAQAVRDQLGDDHYKDSWNTTDTYVLGDVVLHNNSFWIARGGVAANDPPTIGHAIWIALASPQSVLDRRSTGLTVPAADGSNDVSLAVTNTGLYYVEVTSHASTPAQATWTTFTRTGYLGAQREDQIRDPQAANENYYDTTHHSWQSAYLRNPLLGDYRWATSQAPTGWAGHYHSRALVLSSRDWSVGDQLIAFTGVSVERATITTAATGAYDTRTWLRANISDIGVWEAFVRVLTTVATASEIQSLKTALLISILDSTDTPSSFVPLRYWQTNAAGTAVGQVTEPVQHPAVLPVGTIPTTNIGNVVYLTHDHYQGVRSDLTVTTGFFSSAADTIAGYDRGNRDNEIFGTTDRDAGPLEAITGEGVAGDYNLAFIWSFNEHWLNSFTHVVINDVEYPLTDSQRIRGAYYRRVDAQEPTITTASFTLNYKRADDTYAYTQLTTLVNRAGIYQWDPDTNRYDEGLFGPFPVITIGHTVRVGSIYRIGAVLYTPTSDFTVDADRLPPGGSAVRVNWEILTEPTSFPSITNGLAVTVGNIYRTGSTLYTPRSAFTVTAATLPPDGASVEANWRTLVAAPAIVYVSALPTPGSVVTSNYGKIYAVRANDTSALSILAHLKPVDAAVGEWTTGRDPNNASHIGYSLDDSYGELVPAINITALYETSVGSTHHRLVLHVAADGVIPRANVGRSVYFRQYDTNNQYRAVSVEGGADGTYLSTDYIGQFVQPGRRYEVIVISQGAGLSDHQLVTAPPATGRYDFYPNGVKWAILPDADELEHSNVMIQVLQGNLLLPRPTAAEVSYIPQVTSALTFELVDPTTLGVGTADATARAAAATAQTAAEAAQATAGTAQTNAATAQTTAEAARSDAATAQTAAEAAQTTADTATTPTEARALIADWAEEGNTDRPPDDKEPVVVSQAVAEAGMATDIRSWTPLRIHQAILALTPAGSGGGGLATVATQAPVSGTGEAANPVTILNGAITEQSLADSVRNQLGAAAFVSSLTYAINDTATGVDPVESAHAGNISRALEGFVLHRARMFLNISAGTKVLAGRIVKLTSNADENFQRGNNAYTYARTRSYPSGTFVPNDGFFNTTTFGTGEHTVEMIFDGGFTLAQGEYFYVGVQITTSGQTYLIGATGVVEDSHIGTGDFPHTVIEFEGKGNPGSNTPTSTHNFFLNGTYALRMEMDYDVAAGGALLTGREEGAAVYTGALDIDCVGNGLDCSEDTVNDRFRITSNTLTTPEARGLIADWAEFGNTDRPPDNKEPFVVSQPIAEAGTDTDIYSWTAERIAQAIAALAPAGGGGGGLTVTDADNGRLLVVEGGAVVARTPSMIGPEWARSPNLPTNPQNSTCSWSRTYNFVQFKYSMDDHSRRKHCGSYCSGI